MMRIDKTWKICQKIWNTRTSLTLKFSLNESGNMMFLVEEYKWRILLGSVCRIYQIVWKYIDFSNKNEWCCQYNGRACIERGFWTQMFYRKKKHGKSCDFWNYVTLKCVLLKYGTVPYRHTIFNVDQLMSTVVDGFHKYSISYIYVRTYVECLFSISTTVK